MCALMSWPGVLILSVHLSVIEGLPDRIGVGALFEPEHDGQRQAFEWALEEINLRTDILGQTLLLQNDQEVQAQDSFDAHRKVCQMVHQGVAAIFGPESLLAAAHVQSMCDAFEIPHLQWHWDPRDSRDYYSISLFPHYRTLSRAYRDLVRHWQWTEFTVLYEDNEGLTRLQEVLKVPEMGAAKITIRQLQTVNNDYVNLFKDLKENGQNRMVIDCDVTRVKKILHAALKVQMVSVNYHYVFTTLDLGLVDLEDYKHNGAYITSLRLIDPDRPRVDDVRTEWLHKAGKTGDSPLKGFSVVQTEIALAYDAVHLFAHALHELLRAQDVSTTELSCDKSQTWLYGNSMLNYMKSMEFDGMSGLIRYENGERRDFTLDVVELTINGLRKTGTWDRKHGVNITMEFKERKESVVVGHKDKTLDAVDVNQKHGVNITKDFKEMKERAGAVVLLNGTNTMGTNSCGKGDNGSRSVLLVSVAMATALVLGWFVN